MSTLFFQHSLGADLPKFVECAICHTRRRDATKPCAGCRVRAHFHTYRQHHPLGGSNA